MRDSIPMYAFFFNNRKEVIILIVVSGIIGYVLFSLSESPTIDKQEIRYSQKIELESILIHDYQKDQKRWSARGKAAFLSENPKQILIQDVQVVVFDLEQPNDVVMVTIVAKEGLIDWESSQILLQHQVRIQQRNEIELITEKMVYAYDRGIIKIEDEVELRKNEAKITGRELELNIEQQTLLMKQVDFSY